MLYQKLLALCFVHTKIYTEVIECDDILLEYTPNFVYNKIVDQNCLCSTKKGDKVRCIFYGGKITVIGQNIDDIELDQTTIKCRNKAEYIGELIPYTFNYNTNGFHIIEIAYINYPIAIYRFVPETIKKLINTSEHVMKISQDYETRGNWKNIYGSDGYYIVGDKVKLPRYLSKKAFSFLNSRAKLLSTCYNDINALIRCNTTRVGAYPYADKEFDITIVIAGDIYRYITLYFTSYDNKIHLIELQICDSNKMTMLHKEKIEVNDYGQYITFEVKGGLIFKFINIDGPGAILSAIFFDSDIPNMK